MTRFLKLGRLVEDWPCEDWNWSRMALMIVYGLLSLPYVVSAFWRFSLSYLCVNN